MPQLTFVRAGYAAEDAVQRSPLTNILRHSERHAPDSNVLGLSLVVQSFGTFAESRRRLAKDGVYDFLMCLPLDSISPIPRSISEPVEIEFGMLTDGNAQKFSPEP
jgi:hypothetical protein